MKKEIANNEENKIMKTKQYFPFEINMINSDAVSNLIEAHGPKGFGIYVMILTELRHSPNYRCSLNAIKGMARRCKVGYKTLKYVLNDFRLFELSGERDDVIISSPYLDRVMNAYEEKHRKLSEAAVKRNNKFNRNGIGQFTDTIGALDKIRLDKTITTTNSEAPRRDLVNADVEPWEKYLDDAVKDEPWVEILAMNSGISALFMKHRTFVVEAFRRHVRLQGGGSTIYSIRDIKAYFANFLRQGTPTQKRIATQLAEREEEIRQALPNRYETVDSQTGQRSYFGNPIPPDAPPRPNDNAVWSNHLNHWIL